MSDPCYDGHNTLNVQAPPLDVMFALDLNWMNPRVPLFRASIHSLIFISTCRVRLHIIADDETRAFVHGLNFSRGRSNPSLFYYAVPNMDSVQHRFRSKMTLAKAFAERVLPTSIKKVLIADFDTLFLRDPCKLVFDEFEKFSATALFGLAPEYSVWYVSKQPSHAFKIPVPTKEFPQFEGLNAGIILANLERMRAYMWSERWVDFTKGLQSVTDGLQRPIQGRSYPSAYKALFRKGILPLGDQDVFNRYGRVTPEVVHVLPSRWNWQVTESEDDMPYDTIIFHGNTGKLTPDTGNTVHPRAPAIQDACCGQSLFRTSEMTFISLNGPDNPRMQTPGAALRRPPISDR